MGVLYLELFLEKFDLLAPFDHFPEEGEPSQGAVMPSEEVYQNCFRWVHA